MQKLILNAPTKGVAYALILPPTFIPLSLQLLYVQKLTHMLMPADSS